MAQEGEKRQIGEVTHVFGRISVAAIQLSGTLKVGDTISIEGATTHFEQQVESMQIENKDVTEAQSGQAVGIKVKDKVRVGDRVFVVG